MRQYELALILKPDLSEEARKKILTKVKKILEEVGGKIEKEEEWGKKDLAYRVNRQNEGFFVYWEVNLEPARIANFEPKLRLEPEILRYLLVKSEEQPKIKEVKVVEEVKKRKTRAKAQK